MLFRAKFWVVVTTVVVVCLILVGANVCEWKGHLGLLGVDVVRESGACRALTLSEWGDYLGGILSVVALAWFVATLFVQRSQLRGQLEEIQQARQSSNVSLLLTEIRAADQLLSGLCREMCVINRNITPSTEVRPEQQLFEWLQRYADDEEGKDFILEIQGKPAFQRYKSVIKRFLSRIDQMRIDRSALGLYYENYCVIFEMERTKLRS